MEEERAQELWSMLYAGDAGIVSRSPGGFGRIMTVFVIACAAFGLTVAEAISGDHVPSNETQRGRYRAPSPLLVWG